jgi:ribosomal protein S18 acetylase RimI-like enzyme
LTGADDGLMRQAALTSAQAAEVRALAAICNARDGLDLKLEVEVSETPDVGLPRAFLRYDAGALVGFAALDCGDGSDAELCGMVHPTHRRRGIGRSLLSAARAACPALGVTELLLICEAASADGLRFADAVATGLQFAEHHMERDAHIPDAPSFDTPRLDVQWATEADIEALMHVLLAAFGRPVDRQLERIRSALVTGCASYFLARLEGAPVAAVNVQRRGDRTGIYSFGVAPEQRGRGIGRAFLSQLMDLLRAEGATRFALEVDTTNAAAQAVYRACGFVTTTTYGYYVVAL